MFHNMEMIFFMKKVNNKGFGLVEIVKAIAIAMVLFSICAPPLIRFYEKVISEQNINTIVEVPSNKDEAVIVEGNTQVVEDKNTQIVTIDGKNFIIVDEKAYEIVGSEN